MDKSEVVKDFNDPKLLKQLDYFHPKRDEKSEIFVSIITVLNGMFTTTSDSPEVR